MSRLQPHAEWMKLAIAEAIAAGEVGEVPIGAAIVDDRNSLIALTANRRERDCDPTAHAEVLALREAGRKRGNWKLDGCRLYVTLEPCPMCAAAIAQSRIQQVIYGADDAKAGALRSVLNIPDSAASFHRPEVIGGVCEASCRHVLRDWFERLRRE